MEMSTRRSSSFWTAMLVPALCRIEDVQPVLNLFGSSSPASPAIRYLILKMAAANSLWRAPLSHGKLLNLAIALSRGYDRLCQFAVSTEATRDPKIPFDGQNIFVSNDVLCLKELPRTLTVIGAGVVGSEYASLFAALGVRVTLVDL
jgi:hypothetical protein